jgi:hypothetical protein
MSPILSTKKAVEVRLSTLGIPTAYENAEFTPVANQVYLRVQLQVQSPEDPTIGDLYYRERTQLQVFVCSLLNQGTASGITTAESIRSLFAKGTFLSQDGYRIYITTTPQIKGSIKTSDRLVTPVMIDITTDVFN